MTRLKAFGIHFLSSLAVALIIGLSFKLIYYPDFYFEVMDGWRLLLLLIGVDVVMGPLLTLVIYNPKKTKKELRRDISFVVVLQVAALIYGLHIASIARPVYTVFDGERFRIISAGEFFDEALERAPEPLNTLPRFGPKFMWAQTATDPELVEKVSFDHMLGRGKAFWPELFEPLEKHKEQLWEYAEPLDRLKPALTKEQQQSLQISYPDLLKQNELRALPLSGQVLTHYYWAIVNAQGQVLTLLSAAEVEQKPVQSNK